MSASDGIPVGLLDPVSERKSKWTVASAVMINGRIKWKAKNRVRVALSIEKPPQIHLTRFVPMYGIAERRLVMTVAPQNDICLHGKTYPTNAVAITVNRRITPMFRVSRKVYDP